MSTTFKFKYFKETWRRKSSITSFKFATSGYNLNTLPKTTYNKVKKGTSKQNLELAQAQMIHWT